MTTTILQEIKEKLDIVEFISHYVELTKSGNYYKGLCPFHQERNPSFFVSPQKQIFKCFGCNTAGDVVTFYMKIENLNFKEAIKQLCDKLNIDIKAYEQSEEKKIINKKYLDLNRIALNFYKKNLQNNLSVINYLKKRGLKEETINFFDLGYADKGSHLRDYLFSLGYSLEDLQRVGLINSKNEDKFQGRIIFPLIDHKKRLVGFIGRLYPENNFGPKYLNTADSDLFKKSKFLYGLVYSQQFIENQNEVIIVEGQFDLLMSYQNGLKNIVALSGSSFTEDHLSLLKNYTKNFVLALDNDQAGFKNELKMGLLILSNKLDVWKLIFEPAKDLSDFFANEGDIHQIKKIFYIDYLIDYCYQKYDLENLDGKQKMIDLLLPFIKYLDNIKQGYYIAKIADLLKIKEEFLIKEIQERPFNLQPLSYSENENYDYLLSLNNRLEILLERYLTFSLALNDLNKIKEIEEFLEDNYDLKEKILDNENYQELLKLRVYYEKDLGVNFEEELQFLKKEIAKEFYKKKIASYKKIIDYSSHNDWNELKFLIKKLKEIEENQNA